MDLSIWLLSIVFNLAYAANWLEQLPILKQELQLDGTLPILANMSKDARHQCIKWASQNNFMVDFASQDLRPDLQKLLVIEDNLQPFDGEAKINQKVYFFDPEKKTVREKYSINGQEIEQILGQFQGPFFIHTSEKNFKKRRADFRGISFKALTEFQSPSVMFFDTHKAQFSQEMQALDFTNHVKGVAIDVLKMLETELNFSTQIYKSSGWAVPKWDKNHTFLEIPEGMVRELVHGPADMIVTGLPPNYWSHFVHDFLAPFHPFMAGFFVKKGLIAETFDFEVYTQPFETSAWLILFILPVAVSYIVFTNWLLLGNNHIIFSFNSK